MPYALDNPQDGKEPGWRAVPQNYTPAAGEVLVNDPPPAGWVWNAATGTLRPRTNTEALSLSKATRIREIRDALNSWYLQDVRSVEGDVTVYKKATGAVLTAEEASIFNTVNSNYAKRTTAIASVNAATTATQADNVAIPVWDRVT